MRIVRGYVETGFCGGIHEEYFEFEDSVTQQEIDETVRQWGNEQIEIGWIEESE